MIHLQKEKFKYCLDTYVIRDPNCYSCSVLNGKNLLKKIEIAKNAGFSGVELWHSDVKKYLDCGGSILDLKLYVESLNLSIPSYKVMNNWSHTEVLETAHSLGAKSCVVKLLGDEYKGEKPDKNKLIDQYYDLLKKYENYKVKPSIEFMSLAKYFNNINDVCEILESIDHPKKSLVLDTWHLWRNDCNTFKNCPFERIKPNWISVVHFTDARSDVPREKQKDGDRKMPGEGALNLNHFCDKLNNIGFSGWLSLNVYDIKLWEQDPLEVATKGFYSIKKSVDNRSGLADSDRWANSQKKRCEGLWSNSYFSHLDPRINPSNRTELLLNIIKKEIQNKKVLDFKCGFSPLANFVSIGFDAFEGCIDYLKQNFPKSKWYCKSDVDFANWFSDELDVLMHLGLGDSNTEIDSHLKLREKCKPKIVIIEAAADRYGLVDESKKGNRENWERLKQGLKGETYLISTNMKERSYRILFVGK
jgi:sugar phosphate isomerase/epimerase